MNISSALDSSGFQTKGNAEFLLQTGPQQFLRASKTNTDPQQVNSYVKIVQYIKKKIHYK